MPFISVPTKALDRYVELFRAEQAYDAAGCSCDARWAAMEYRHGYMQALRDLLPSETVGTIIMDGESIVHHGEPCLPRLVLSDR